MSIFMQQDHGFRVPPALLMMLGHYDGGNNANAAILFPQNPPHGNPTKTEWVRPKYVCVVA